MSITNVNVRTTSLEVIEAKNYLRNNMPNDGEELHFIGVTYEGEYPRYHFYKGDNRNIIYTVISEEERESTEVEETFAV